jgi:diguanylate cyclase (GGDEF)-like protein
LSPRFRASREVTSWMLLLAVSIVLPILVLLGSFVKDVSGQIAVADGERLGLRSLGALSVVFRDASAYRAGGSILGSTAGRLTIERDIAAMDAMERRHPLGGEDWKAASATWRGAPSAQGLSTFIGSLAQLFPLVSDRSGLTYDPDVAGIDLADSLTYRLPIAIDQLQRAELLLHSSDPGAVAGRLELSQNAGHAQGYLSDGLSETAEAAGLNREFAVAVGADERHASATTGAALAALAAFEQHPSNAMRGRALGAVRSGIRDLYALLRDTRPALHALIDERAGGLEHRRFVTVVLGIIIMVAASLIALFGTRGALHRAELKRIRRTAAELHHHAMHDALTGLPNRSALTSAIDERLSAVRHAAGAVAVLFIDLDNFKLINDSLGHEAGDGVLCVVSRRLASVGAAANAVLVARFGGDEFAILLTDPKAGDIRAHVDSIVAHIASTLTEPVTINAPFDQRIVISASVGIAFLDGHSSKEHGAADLLREADAAMYEAKARGRARAETFGPAMRERATRKLRLMTDLRGASERGELALEFQPFVRLTDGEAFGSEALLRWHHPKLGLLAPASFLSIAEETGSLVAIGRWAFEEAIRCFAAGDAPPGTIHVNVSARELFDESLDTIVADLLGRYGVAPTSLAIEVIEGSLIRSGDRAERMLRKLRAMGAKIWIDDFGVEYSSLRYLHRLPIDGVKIDRTFVGGADGSLAAPTIVRLIVELARSLELGVVAEGVETIRQRDALLELGCMHGQGYLYSTSERSASERAVRLG